MPSPPLASVCTITGLSQRWAGLTQTRLFGEFLRYFAVSATALALDFGIMVSLVQMAGWHYQWAAALGFSAGTVWAFVLSVHWVFQQRSFARWHEGLAQFAVIGALGLLLNAGLLQLLAGGLGLDYRWAKLAAAGLSFLFNFAGRRILLFSRARIASPTP
jgi:putative flippase GtrA